MSSSNKLTPKQYESLGRMTQNLLHAANNSLGSITGFAEFLMEDLPPTTQAHSFARNIHQSGQHLKKLIEQIRTINAAPQIARIETVDLCEALEQLLVDLTEAMPDELNITIEYDCDLDNAPITGNYTLFCLAILDIINNALEALNDTPDQENKTIYLSLTRSANGKFYTITIRDNGHGMGQLAKSECATPFFTTKDSSLHHGLGLNVAIAILENMGGNIEITTRTEPEGETSVSIQLPAKE